MPCRVRQSKSQEWIGDKDEEEKKSKGEGRERNRKQGDLPSIAQSPCTVPTGHILKTNTPEYLCFGSLSLYIVKLQLSG